MSRKFYGVYLHSRYLVVDMQWYCTIKNYIMWCQYDDDAFWDSNFEKTFRFIPRILLPLSVDEAR